VCVADFDGPEEIGDVFEGFGQVSACPADPSVYRFTGSEGARWHGYSSSPWAGTMRSADG
jgi:hypothetical protein